MPNDGKICSFNCVYCEAGYNEQGKGTTGVPSRKHVKTQLARKLAQMVEAGETLDVITFSGNGEPTLHPEFANIVHDVLLLRDRYFPQAKVTVLSNATMAGNDKVAAALNTIDNNVLKLDSAVPSTMRLINQPQSPNVTPEWVIADLSRFAGRCVVQTMILRGEHDGKKIDNTTTEEVNALIDAYKQIKPREVMLYSIDRKTPEEHLEKVERGELEKIGAMIEKEGIKVSIS